MKVILVFFDASGNQPHNLFFELFMVLATGSPAKSLQEGMCRKLHLVREAPRRTSAAAKQWRASAGSVRSSDGDYFFRYDIASANAQGQWTATPSISRLPAPQKRLEQLGWVWRRMFDSRVQP